MSMTMTSYLNTENMERSRDGVEYHPLRPFLPEKAKVLFLGSFPPQRKRWCMDFYYPNFINDHWRIEGQIFFGDKNHFVDLEAKRFRIDEIVAFCEEKGLAFFDTSTAIRRLQDRMAETPKVNTYVRVSNTDGTDETDSLANTDGTDETDIFANTNMTNGGGLLLYRLPSSSRAYPLSFDKKVEAYRRFFDFIKI